LNAVFIRCPFARCLSMVKQGQADMIFGLKKLPEREKSLIFLNPPLMVQYNPLRFFTLSSHKLLIHKLEDLNALTVGILRGAKYYDLFDTNHNIVKVEVTSREQLVSMLLKGRIDTFIDREESIIPLLSANEYKQKISLAHYKYTQSINSYIAISKHSEIKNIANALSYHLNKYMKNGVIEKIKVTNRSKFLATKVL
jgi:ABC-type amino acid transport substrate-binding protein